MTERFEPVFLQNSPSVMCDQILYLVKNSNLNFELHETPFSLNLAIKKSFAHHWNKSSHQSAQHSEAHVPQHVYDPARHHSPHRPQHHALVPQAQVVQGVGPQQQQQQQQHQQQHNNPEIATDPVQQLSQNLPQHKTQASSELDVIQAKYQKVKAENVEAHKEYAELEKSHRKLTKEHKELQTKHSKVCLEVKTLKTEKEIISKESNALSVALQSTKKHSESSFRQSMKDIEALKEELANLIQYKIQHQEEIRKAKKAEKKLRQKEKKETSGIAAALVVDKSKPVSDDQSNEVHHESETASDDIKDIENNLELKTETNVFKSEDPRFLDFPSSFADWSEDQKKDAYENNFKLYVQKYFFIPSGSLPD